MRSFTVLLSRRPLLRFQDLKHRPFCAFSAIKLASNRPIYSPVICCGALRYSRRSAYMSAHRFYFFRLRSLLRYLLFLLLPRYSYYLTKKSGVASISHSPLNYCYVAPGNATLRASLRAAAVILLVVPTCSGVSACCTFPIVLPSIRGWLRRPSRASFIYGIPRRSQGVPGPITLLYSPAFHIPPSSTYSGGNCTLSAASHQTIAWPGGP